MRVRQQWIILGGLELLALALSKWQALGGVRSDEAKYLLNIPYPHPPLLRSVMSFTENLPFQEGFWRLLLATLLVQAVWLVWDMTRTFHLEDRILVCAGWLLSSAVLTQAGSIMMAPVTALQALFFLWLSLRPDVSKKIPGMIGLLWLASLFTAYQVILFLPLVWSLLRRSGQSRSMTALYVFAPILLLALYSLANPLTLGAMLIRRDQGISISLLSRFMGLGKLIIIGGAGVASVLGIWGIAKSRDRGLQMSLLLVCGFLFFSIPQTYYAILFTPLFVAGLYSLFHGRHHPHAQPLLAGLIAACAVITWFAQPGRIPSHAREVAQAIAHQKWGGRLMIAGSFGHEWQYEYNDEILRYRPELESSAQAIICLNTCEPMFNTTGWKLLPGVPVQAWVQK